VDSNTLAATPPFGTTPAPQPADALHDATLELLATEDAGAVAGKALAAAGRVLVVQGSSIWVPSGDRLHCRGAIGEQRDRLSGVSAASEELDLQLDHEGDLAIATAPIAVGPRTVAILRVTRSLATTATSASRSATHFGGSAPPPASPSLVPTGSPPASAPPPRAHESSRSSRK